MQQCPDPRQFVITRTTLATCAAHPDSYRPFPVSVLPSPVREYVAASSQAIGWQRSA
jgi:hypothetical protein